MRKTPTMRAGLAALLCVAQAACVTVDIPAKANPGANAKVSEVPEAINYLLVSRAKLESRARNLEGFDAATRLGVGVAVVGSGVSATLEHHAAKRVARFMTGGAVAYIANRNVAPRDISRIYRAGVTNLDCIRSAALLADRDAKVVTAEILQDPAIESSIVEAINTLLADIDRIHSLPADEEANGLAAAVANSVEAIRSARAALRTMHKFQENPWIGETVVAGVNTTLQVVNQQALAQTPDVEAILQSGSAFGLFLNAGGTMSKDIRDAMAALGASRSVTQAFIDRGGVNQVSLAEQFKRDQLVLQGRLARIPDTSIEAELSTVNECKTVVEALTPITVSPSPIVLTAGGEAVKLTITGAGPFTARGLPKLVAFNPDKKTLAAGASTAVGEYIIHITGHGVDSGPLPMKVEAKPAADGAGQGGPPPTPTTGH